MLCNEIPSLEKGGQAMIERLNIVKFNFTLVEKGFLNKHVTNKLIDKNLKRKLNKDTELKQAFVDLLFQYAFENIDKNIPAPKAFAIAKEEYLDDIDIVKLFLGECVILTGEEQDKLKTSELYRVFRDVFKTRCEDMMSLREFAKSVERHKLQQTKSGGLMYIRKIEWKPPNDDIGFIPDNETSY